MEVSVLIIIVIHCSTSNCYWVCSLGGKSLRSVTTQFTVGTLLHWRLWASFQDFTTCLIAMLWVN